jgi:hypothetical protein
MTSWNPSQVTVSPPQTITVRFSREGAIDGQVTYSSSDITTTIVSEQLIGYVDREGIEQRIIVATGKREETRKSFGKVNPAAVSSLLSKGASTGTTGISLLSQVLTLYDVKVNRSGPFLKGETVVSKISIAELAGRLSVPSYAAYTPSTGLITSSVLETQYLTALTPDGPVTRSFTVGRIALGLTQAGQQAFAQQMQQRSDLDFDTIEGGAFISKVVNSMATLVAQGAEVRDESGAPPVPIKPLESEIARDSVSETDNGRRTTRARLANDSDLDTVPTTTRIYDMPFAPDDFYSWEEP